MNNNETKKTNTISIIGFIFSFFIGIVGLILSIIGLKKSKEYNSGKELSIAGIILSSINIVVTTILFIFFSLVLISFNVVDEIKDDVIELGNNLTNEYLCSISYNCVKTSNGFSCVYENEEGKEKRVNCDYNNDYNQINKEDLIGKWIPKKIINTNNEEISIENYYGTSSLSETFNLTFNENNTYINSLSLDGTAGTYSTSERNIELSNDNFTLNAEIIDGKIDCLTLIEVDGTIIYLYKEDNNVFE